MLLLEWRASRGWMGGTRFGSRSWVSVAVAWLISLAGALQPCALFAAPTPRLQGFTYADYNSELREATARADGIKHVDTPRLIQKLVAGNIKTYAFLVWHQPTDWDDFRLEFLSAAQAARLNVWLYLTPPSENHPPSGYVPYGTNYIAWAAETARLAQQYPVLTALAIDDFNGNETFFTPGYVSNMMSVAHVYCTNLVFLPVNYDLSHNPGAPTNNISPAFANAYGPHCGGVIFPYLNWSNKDELTNESAQITCNSDIMKGKFAQFVVQFPSYTPSSPGDYAALSVTTNHPAGFPDVPHPFSFRLCDSYDGPTAGYHKLQVLVDGTVVWEGDTAGALGIQEHTLNLQSHLRGRQTATITVRVYEAKGVGNYRVAVSWNLPPGDWTRSETGSFVGTSSHYPANPGLDVPLIVMIYNSGYGSGTNRWTPSLEYLRQANEIAFDSVRARQAAGIIQYCLDKSDSSQQYPIVQGLYGQWVSHPWFDPLILLSDGRTLLSGGNGPGNQAYTLKGAAALMTPWPAWRVLAEGQFDIHGNFTAVDSALRNNTPRFYRLSVP